MVRPRAVAALGVVVALLRVTSALAADGDFARARDAYERGTAAYSRGEYARAAAEFARADSIEPSPVALRAALDAATLADDPVLGTELVERATSRATKDDAALETSLTSARARFAHRTGRVVVKCPASGTCLATIDGVAIDTSKPRVVSVGGHTVGTQTDGAVEPHIIDVQADATVVVTARVATPKPPAPPPPAAHVAKEEHPSGLPRVAFFTTLGLTVVVGGLATWSAIDTSSKHSAFVGAGCTRAAVAGCDIASNAGQNAQIRTNTLLAATGLFAVSTAALGLFVVPWRSARPEVAITPNGAAASMHFRF